MEKSCIILSGGLDSTTLLYDIVEQFGNENVFAISFNYNQNHSKEIYFAEKTCKKLNVNHQIIDLSSISYQIFNSALLKGAKEVPEGHYQDEVMKKTVVPNRNMVLLSIAASFCISNGINNLYYGAHSGDHTIYPDCRPEFIKAMKEVLLLCDWQSIELKVPYMNWNKADIVRRGKELGVDYSLTWTCYKGQELACGKCGSCIERLEAFNKNNLIDPIKYE